METILKTFLSILGWGIIWFVGLIIIPIFLMLLYGLVTNYDEKIDDDRGLHISFCLSVVIYMIISAIFLIAL